MADYSSLRTNCIACWELDETSGTDVIDATGSITGTLVGTNPNNMVGKTGKINYAYQLNGTDAYINYGDSFDFGSNQDFTISIWMKGIDALKHIWNKRHSSSPNQGIFLYFENRTIYTDSGGEERDNSFDFSIDVGASVYDICTGKDSVSPTSTNWHLIVCYRSGTTIGISLDGGAARTYTNANIGADISNGNSFYVGTRRLADIFYSGYFDQTAVWNKVLTSTEIGYLYNDGDGLPYTSWVAWNKKINNTEKYSKINNISYPSIKKVNGTS